MKTGVLRTGVTITLLLSGGAAVSAQTEIRYAHMNSPSHFVNTKGQAMVDAIGERTDGEVSNVMFPSGQLGENSAITEQISLGGGMIGQVGVGTLANYVPDFSIIVLPFLYLDPLNRLTSRSPVGSNRAIRVD